MFTLLKDGNSNGYGQRGEPDVVGAIKALERIELVRNERGQYQLEQDFTKAQEAIVEAVGMTKARNAERVNEKAKWCSICENYA